MVAGANGIDDMALQPVLAPSDALDGMRGRDAILRLSRRILLLAIVFSAPPPADLIRRIGELRIPVHVDRWCGDLLPGRVPVEALAGVFRNGSVEMLDAIGHYPWVDQSEALSCVVRRWSSTQAEG